MSFIKKPVSASVNSIYSQGIHSWFRLEACNHKFSSQIQTTKQRLRQKVRIKELTKTDPSKNGKKKYNIPDQHKQPLINHKSNRYTQNPSITTTTTAYKKKNSTIFNRTSQTLHGTVKLSQACQIQKHARKQVQIKKRSKENGVKSITSLGPRLSISMQAYKRQFRRDWYHKIIDFNQCCVVHGAHGETKGSCR